MRSMKKIGTRQMNKYINHPFKRILVSFNSSSECTFKTKSKSDEIIIFFSEDFVLPKVNNDGNLFGVTRWHCQMLPIIPYALNQTYRK